MRSHAAEWFERGEHDIEAAQLLCEERGFTDTIAYIIQQAIEKYLKGFLIYNGIKPKRTHDLSILLNEAVKFEDTLEEFIDFCDKATKYYIENRYPPGPPIEYRFEEIKKSLDNAWRLIRKIREKTGIQ
ncbi:MAG: HEPN domain protein [Candidatus Methanolliviera sp. GoM_oil]|nr:MAG: HEPN domain protein [Candidatus Methanolliviera sp. GoM_oil]